MSENQRSCFCSETNFYVGGSGHNVGCPLYTEARMSKKRGAKIPQRYRAEYDACVAALSAKSDEPWIARCKTHIETIAALDAIRKESIKALERRIARHTACSSELRRNNVDGLCNDCKEDFNLLARAREFAKE